jgi:cytochrome c peroxidase
MKRLGTAVFLILFFGFSLILLSNRCSHNDILELSLGEVPVPQENPITSEKVELGRALFFDKRLSKTNEISCASCHIPKFAFADRKAFSHGVEGRQTSRNAPSLLNSAYLKTMMFDAHLPTLEQQVIVPIQEHQEMDMKMGDLIKKLSSIPQYKEQAEKIFKRDFDAYVLTRSIAAFERTLISQNSRFDKYYHGDKKALNKEELLGYKLFTQKLYCAKCHPPPHFTTYKAENNGIYTYFSEDKGRFRIFNDSNDIGKFKIPSLRNIELTFPYMHDGSLVSLEDVLAHYEKGGNKSMNQSPTVLPFRLKQAEKEAIISFLKTLTDTSYLIYF